MLPLTSPIEDLPKLTVIRAILQVGMRGTTSATDYFGAFGISVVTRDALTAAAVPDPISDLVDWYWHKNFVGQRDADAGSPYMYHDVDLRSGRAIRGEDRTMAFILDVNAASASGVTFSLGARLLLAH